MVLVWISYRTPSLFTTGRQSKKPMTQPTPYKKPIPMPDETSQPFFDGAKDHRLMLQSCSTCGTAMWPVKSRCPACLSSEITWVQSSGKGTLYTFSLMHQVSHPGFAS